MVVGHKKEEAPSEGKRITGLVLMGIGVIIMGGVGFGFLLENLTE
jgi:preprotein translocase subunit Sss1